MIESLVDVLVEFAAMSWFPLVVLAVAAADAVIPVVPSETLLIVGGAAAALDDQSLVVIIACGAIGAFVGDSLSYQLGSVTGRALQRRTSPRARRRLRWANREIRRRRGILLLTARFVPGGRTAVTLASGVTQQSRARFHAWVAVAVILWAGYAAGLGFVFGRAFADNHTVAFAAAFGVAAGIALVSEVIRWRRRRARPDRDEPADLEPVG